MRLLQKATRSYILFTSLLFLIAGGLLYGLLTDIIEQEATEQLLGNERRIAEQLRHGQHIINLPPVLEVSKLNRPIQESITVKDTIAFDNVENELEAFLQVSSVRNISGHSYRIVLRQMIVEPVEYMSTIGLSMAIVMVLLLMFTVLMNRIFFHQLWSAFYRSLATLKGFSVHQNTPLKLEDSSILEFSELNAAIGKLTEKARSDFRALKEFSENASHETQTPLAIIQARLDELLQDPALSEQQANHIQSAYVAAQKLSKLNQTLLLLTKIENQQFKNTELININDLIGRQISQLDDFVRDKGLQVHVNQQGTLTVLSNPALVDMLISNLLSNAIRHNVRKGFIEVMVTARSLTVKNSGVPLKGSPAKLFERFHKANPSSSSLGLGLAIVRSVCNLYGWQVQYQAEDNTHILLILF
ncbi:sensor histidine kinase [Pontibacter actiniarum]|uniref:histidine kinase n=1 Tax=Pontibacter actiniarum TaxID=323450 RepID=A0A1X9YXK3_9BACT|nr:HAMP domain-containing sensor histidine kinase [Pontibacter actiniarum]ARS37562.1 two-component sensor histidine kinase [Pontibacter actiniarum]